MIGLGTPSRLYHRKTFFTPRNLPPVRIQMVRCSNFGNPPAMLNEIKVLFLALLFAFLGGCSTPAEQSYIVRPDYQLMANQAPLAEPPIAQPSDQLKVWVNTPSGVYHYPGTRWFGNTNEGEYMSEKDALASGYRPATNGQ